MTIRKFLFGAMLTTVLLFLINSSYAGMAQAVCVYKYGDYGQWTAIDINPTIPFLQETNDYLGAIKSEAKKHSGTSGIDFVNTMAWCGGTEEECNNNDDYQITPVFNATTSEDMCDFSFDSNRWADSRARQAEICKSIAILVGDNLAEYDSEGSLEFALASPCPD